MVSFYEMRGCSFAYIDGADEELGAHHDAAEDNAEDDGHDPRTNKSFHRLLGRELDELSATESNTADVGPDIVGDDQGGGEEEPDHALEDVVHDEMGLHNDEVESHMRPGKVGELELVVSSLERGDEKNEAWRVLDRAVLYMKPRNIPNT